MLCNSCCHKFLSLLDPSTVDLSGAIDLPSGFHLSSKVSYYYEAGSWELKKGAVYLLRDSEEGKTTCKKLESKASGKATLYKLEDFLIKGMTDE